MCTHVHPRTLSVPVFRERSSKKIVSFEGQMISKEKNMSVLLSTIEAIVFVSLKVV